jgi:DNA gyrase subunit B
MLADGIHDRATLACPGRLEALATALRAGGDVVGGQHVDELTETPYLNFVVSNNGSGRKLTVNADLLAQYEFRQMARSFEQLSVFGRAPYTVHQGEETRRYAGMDELLDEIYKIAEKGLSIQRYKGLGEMNPEQLWDTTMNPDTRRLLQVRVEDEVGAHQLFTTLMGDEVEPRRQFIQDNALDVKNLDI